MPWGCSTDIHAHAVWPEYTAWDICLSLTRLGGACNSAHIVVSQALNAYKQHVHAAMYADKFKKSQTGHVLRCALLAPQRHCKQKKTIMSLQMSWHALLPRPGICGVSPREACIRACVQVKKAGMLCNQGKCSQLSFLSLLCGCSLRR